MAGYYAFLALHSRLEEYQAEKTAKTALMKNYSQSLVTRQNTVQTLQQEVTRLSQE